MPAEMNHQPGVEAGKKAAAGVLELQHRVIQALRERGENGATCEEIAKLRGQIFDFAGCVRLSLQAAVNNRNWVAVAHDAGLLGILDPEPGGLVVRFEVDSGPRPRVEYLLQVDSRPAPGDDSLYVRIEMMAKYDTIEGDADRYDTALQRWLALGAADLEARIGAVCDELGLPAEEVKLILDQLEARMTFLCRRGGEDVVWAYPVTAEETPHRVTLDTGERFFAA